MAKQSMTRDDVLARVLEAARADGCVVPQYAERLVDEVIEDHDPYETPPGLPGHSFTDSDAGEDAVIDLLGRVLRWLDRDRRDLSALVECLAVDSGVSLPYATSEQPYSRKLREKKAHPDAWIVIEDDVRGAKVRPRYRRPKTSE